MLIFINNYTQFVWVYFTSSINVPAVSLQIEGFILIIWTQFNARIKCWRTNGSKGKFINTMVTKINCYHGILYELSTSAVKQQNGLIKQCIQILKNMEHSMCIGAGILDDYWFQAESLAVANHTINLLPLNPLDNNFLYLLLYGK